MNVQIYIYIDRQIDRYKDRCVVLFNSVTQIDERTDRQIDRYIDRKKDLLSYLIQ